MDTHRIRNYHPADRERYVRFHTDAESICRCGDTFFLASLKGESPTPIEFSEDDIFLAEEQGRIVGACRVVPEPAIDRAVLMLLIAPDSFDGPATTELLRSALRRADDLKLAKVHADLRESDSAGRDLFAGLGFKPVRRYAEMAVELDPASIPESKHEELSHRPLEPGCEAEFTELQNRAFDGSWGFCPNTTTEIIQQLNAPGYGHDGVIISYLRKEAVGYCWTAEAQEPDPASDRPIGRIHMMGIAPKFCGRGFGKYVLSSGLKHLADKGVKTVELTMDPDNDPARSLYERAGFKRKIAGDWYEKIMG